MSFKLHLAVQHPVSDVSRTTVMFTNAAVTLSVRHVQSEVDITVIGLAAGHVMGTSLTVLLCIIVFINSNTFLHRLQLTNCTNVVFSCLARRSTIGLYPTPQRTYQILHLQTHRLFFHPLRKPPESPNSSHM